MIVWDLPSFRRRTVLTATGGPVLALEYSSDGKTLATGGDDGVLRLWDGAAGRVLRTLEGHTDAITWIAFSPRPGTIATASRDATIKLWDENAAGR